MPVLLGQSLDPAICLLGQHSAHRSDALTADLFGVIAYPKLRGQPIGKRE
jgi:hypothetical protein